MVIFPSEGHHRALVCRFVFQVHHLTSSSSGGAGGAQLAPRVRATRQTAHLVGQRKLLLHPSKRGPTGVSPPAPQTRCSSQSGAGVLLHTRAHAQLRLRLTAGARCCSGPGGYPGRGSSSSRCHQVVWPGLGLAAKRDQKSADQLGSDDIADDVPAGPGVRSVCRC